MSLRQDMSIGCLVLNQTCGKLAPLLQQHIESLIRNNGDEWTCGRIKAIWAAALNLADGHPEKAKDVYQQNSIAYNRETMTPKGPFGVLVKRYLDARRPSVQRRAAAALRFYTAFQRPNNSGISPKQKRKAIAAISDPSPVSFSDKVGTPGLLYGQVVDTGQIGTVLRNWETSDRHKVFTYKEHSQLEFVDPSLTGTEYYLELLRGKKDLPSEGLLVDVLQDPNAIVEACIITLKDRMKRRGYVAKPIRSEDDGAEHLRPMSYYYSPVPENPKARLLPNRFKEIPYGRMVVSLNSTEWIPESLDRQTRCYEMRQVMRSKGLHDSVAGRISAIQEQGYKARVVAQPSAWVQLAFQPYHKRLAKACVELFPFECDVYDQVKGVYDIMGHMANDEVATCVDLRSATDRFPRFLTIKLIQVLGYPEYAQALEEISTKDWACYFAEGGKISYGAGQPMGAYGSFPAFTLSNLVLSEVAVRAALTERAIMASRGTDCGPKLASFPSGARFHIVGDDDSFSDKRVSEIYTGMLKTLGVETSPEKCFEGGKVAEYAGFIIRKTDANVTAFRPYKIPSVNYVTNPLEFVHALGSGVLSIPGRRKKYWEKAFNAYQATLSDRDPTLAPLIADPVDISPANRASARDLVVLSLGLQTELEEKLGARKSRMRKFYPVLDDTIPSRINSRPLIDEARPDQLFRYNPADMIHEDKPARDVFVYTVRRFNQDPLIRDYISKGRVDQEAQDIVVSSPLEIKDSAPDTPSQSVDMEVALPSANEHSFGVAIKDNDSPEPQLVKQMGDTGATIISDGEGKVEEVLGEVHKEPHHYTTEGLPDLEPNEGTDLDKSWKW